MSRKYQCYNNYINMAFGGEVNENSLLDWTTHWALIDIIIIIITLWEQYLLYCKRRMP